MLRKHLSAAVADISFVDISYEMSVIALLSLLALSFANPVPQAASKAASNNAALIGQVHSDVLQFLQTHQPIDQADADRQDDFFVNQTQRLESIPTLQQQLGKKHSWACAPWRTNPLPSLVWCMQAEADLGLMEWHEGTVFQQQDPATGRCQPGVGACLPLVFGEGDCQIVLDFYDEEEKTETSSELHIEEMVLWEILKCQAWR